MTQREQIEGQIREVLARESSAIVLSNKLFSPEGLFSRMAKTEEERRSVVQSPLFKEAQKQLLALQHKEAVEFKQAIEQAQGTLSEAGYLFKLEPTAST